MLRISYIALILEAFSDSAAIETLTFIGMHSFLVPFKNDLISLKNWGACLRKMSPCIRLRRSYSAVCLSFVIPATMAELIEMPFGRGDVYSGGLGTMH